MTTVEAAGGVVSRAASDGQVELALVHRPAYDDWTLPKGKLLDGETHERAALREVEEETGLLCEVLRPVGDTAYVDRKGREKVVSYWLMKPLSGSFRPSEEVDELRWLPLDDALALLSYEQDRALVRRANLS